MVRMRFSEGFSVPRPEKSAVTAIFIGPLGHGVGLAADILAHVAEAARHDVVRDRRISAGSKGSKGTAAPRDGFLARRAHGKGCFASRHRRCPPNLRIWSWLGTSKAALAFAHLLKSPEDLYILAADRVPVGDVILPLTRNSDRIRSLVRIGMRREPSPPCARSA